MMESLSHRRPVFESLADIYFLGDEREAAMGRVGAQRPVLRVNKLKKTSAGSAAKTH